MATELALERVNREAAVLPFPLQHITGHHAAGQVMALSLRRRRLTAMQPELSWADADDCLALGTHARAATDLRGRQDQAVGGVGLGAMEAIPCQ
jgi:hypothetical protein